MNFKVRSPTPNHAPLQERSWRGLEYGYRQGLSWKFSTEQSVVLVRFVAPFRKAECCGHQATVFSLEKFEEIGDHGAGFTSQEWYRHISWCSLLINFVLSREWLFFKPKRS